MITRDKTVRPFRVQRYAVIDAMWHYGKWKKVKFWGFICFWIDLVDHLINGFVLVRPDLFWMMKLINVSKTDKPEPAWFIRMAVGDLRDVIMTMPVVLPKVVFCRRWDKRVRIYPMEAIMKKGMGILK